MIEQQDITPQHQVNAAQAFLSRAQLSGEEAFAFVGLLDWLRGVPGQLEDGAAAARERDELALELRRLTGAEAPAEGPSAGIAEPVRP